MYVGYPDAGESAAWQFYLKELRIWSPKRNHHDLLDYQRRYLDEYNPAFLWSYWKFEKDLLDVSLLVDTSYNRYGTSVTAPANPNTIWDS